MNETMPMILYGDHFMVECSFYEEIKYALFCIVL